MKLKWFEGIWFLTFRDLLWPLVTSKIGQGHFFIKTLYQDTQGHNLCEIESIWRNFDFWPRVTFYQVHRTKRSKVTGQSNMQKAQLEYQAKLYMQYWRAAINSLGDLFRTRKTAIEVTAERSKVTGHKKGHRPGAFPKTIKLVQNG